MTWWGGLLGPSAGAAEPVVGGDALISLKYASVLDGGADSAEATLANILATALKNNPPKNISGMLYYERQSQGLVQVLEGPTDAIDKLFEIIVADPRHYAINVLDRKQIETRQFPEFGMALARATDADHLQKLSNSVEGFAEHLVRLQYSSTLAASDAEHGRMLIRDILAVAVRKNSELRIGGILVFNPTTLKVVQLLEGPADAVRPLFLTIMADTRHADCCLESEELLLRQEDYIFGSSWGMLQSETQQTNLVDLAARLRHSYHASAARAAMDESESALGVGPTPISSFMM